MTKEEKLHAVETAIRKALPRLIELSHGCLIRYWDNRIYTMVLNTPREIAFIDRNIDHCSFQVIKPDQINVIEEVIGHDILISDVLEFLGKKGKNINYDYSVINLSNNILNVNLVTQISDVEHHAYEEIWDKFEIDLSKPRLADQSEELINRLYSFLTN